MAASPQISGSSSRTDEVLRGTPGTAEQPPLGFGLSLIHI